MNYIKKEDGNLTCSHPQVKNLHEYGGSMGSIMFSNIALILHDGTRKDFDITKDIKDYSEAEEYLETLNKKAE